MTVRPVHRLVVASRVGLCLAPLTAAAQLQPGKVYRIGVLAAYAAHFFEFDGFRGGFRDLGYTEGENLLIDWRYAEQGPAQLPALAAERVRLQPALIHATGTPAA